MCEAPTRLVGLPCSLAAASGYTHVQEAILTADGALEIRFARPMGSGSRTRLVLSPIPQKDSVTGLPWLLERQKSNDR